MSAYLCERVQESIRRISGSSEQELSLASLPTHQATRPHLNIPISNKCPPSPSAPLLMSIISALAIMSNSASFLRTLDPENSSPHNDKVHTCLLLCVWQHQLKSTQAYCRVTSGSGQGVCLSQSTYVGWILYVVHRHSVGGQIMHKSYFLEAVTPSQSGGSVAIWRRLRSRCWLQV